MKRTLTLLSASLFLAACAGSDTVASAREEGGNSEDTSRPSLSDGDVTDSGAGSGDSSDTGVSDDGGLPDTGAGDTGTMGDTAVQPDTSTATCGDGVLDAGEECDDGNRRAGDGCSFNCTIECGAGNDTDFDGVCNPNDICPGFDDNIDTNGNGVPDGCDASTEQCDDGIDNDLDGATDCADTDCASLAICAATPGTETSCSDGRDNDGDLDIDCLDFDCIFDPVCSGTGGFETDCSNGVDDDGDFDVDCLDFDCDFDPACTGGGGGSFGLETACSDGADDDGDGLVDCLDGDCIFDISCTPPANATGENCTNGVDDDGDVAIDCDDADCQTVTACLPAGTQGTCNNPFTLASFGHYNVPPGTIDRQASGCGPFAGNDRVIAFTSPVTGPICVTALGSSDDLAIEVRTTCNQAASALACEDDTIGLDPVVGFDAVAGTTYYIIYDAWSSTPGIPWNFYNYLGPCR